MACHGFCPLQLHSQSYFGRGFRPINSSSWHSKAIGKCLGTEAADALWQGGEGKDLDELGNPKLVGGETHVYTVNTLLLHNVYYVKYKIYSHNNYYNIIYVEWPHHTMICSVECCHYVVATHIYRHKAKKQIVMETYGCGPDNRVPQSGCLLGKGYQSLEVSWFIFINFANWCHCNVFEQQAHRWMRAALRSTRLGDSCEWTCAVCQCQDLPCVGYNIAHSVLL